MMNLANAIYNLLPGAAYRGLVDDSTEAQFDAVEWCDERPKPTWADCVAMMASDHQPTYYSPDKIILAVDAMGKASALEQMIAAAEPRVRLRWQKAVTFNGEDPDFVGLVDYFQMAWQLTDEQRAAFLKQCEEQPL
jgi:hypothetical protein